MAGGGTEVGNGYVTIKPTLDEGAIGGIQSKGGTAGQGFGNAFTVAAGNLISSGIEKLGSALVDTFKNAFDNYANFEQLSGGVEKIFDQADISGIMKDAQDAYLDLNMSANQYLESINKTGAAFAQTMGDQKGYDTARTGMKAIADYASGTGRNLDELNDKYAMITRATSSYQSIADQFSGILPATSADFLEQAQAAGFLSGEYAKLTDVPVAEYQEAVTKMLEKGVDDMGLLGNTAAEATGTVSGSLAMLGASWQNFLTGIMDENADMGALGERLLQSIGAVIANVAPRIGIAVSRAVLELPGAIASALSQLPTLLEPTILAVFGEDLGGRINGALGGAFSSMGETFSQLGASLSSMFEGIWAVVGPVVSLIGEAVAAAMPIVQTAIQTVVDFLANSVIPTVNSVLATVAPVIQQIASDIGAKLPQIQAIVEQAMAVVKGVVDTVWPHVQSIISTVVSGVSRVVSTAWPVISSVIDTAMAAIGSIIDVAWPAIQSVIETVMGAIEGIVSNAWPVIEGVVTGAVDVIKGAIEGIESVVGTVQSIFDGVRAAIEDPIGTARSFIEDFCSAIESIIGGLDLSLPSIALPHFNVWGGEFPFGIAGQGSMPEFSIEWYAKGGMVDGAQLIGAGERGAELVWPSYDPYLTKYADAIADRMGGRGGVDIHDCTFNVRKESDIRKVASELNALINRQTAGGYA